MTKGHNGFKTIVVLKDITHKIQPNFNYLGGKSRDRPPCYFQTPVSKKF